MKYMQQEIPDELYRRLHDAVRWKEDPNLMSTLLVYATQAWQKMHDDGTRYQ